MQLNPPEVERNATLSMFHCVCGQYHVQVTLTTECAAGDIRPWLPKSLRNLMDLLIISLGLVEQVPGFMRSLPKGYSSLTEPGITAMQR